KRRPAGALVWRAFVGICIVTTFLSDPRRQLQFDSLRHLVIHLDRRRNDLWQWRIQHQFQAEFDRPTRSAGSSNRDATPVQTDSFRRHALELEQHRAARPSRHAWHFDTNDDAPAAGKSTSVCACEYTVWSGASWWATARLEA